MCTLTKYQKGDEGHCMAVTMEMRGKLVIKSALHLQTEGSVTPAVEAEGQVNG